MLYFFFILIFQMYFSCSVVRKMFICIYICVCVIFYVAPLYLFFGM